MQKRCLAFLLLVACALSLPGGTFVLKNDFLTLVVDPAGGRIISVRPAGRKAELTSGDGLLSDNFWNIQSNRFFLKDKLYDVNSLDPQTLALSAHHRGGGIDFMQLNKVIALPARSAMFQVDYRFNNLAAAMGELRYGFWMQNFVGTAGSGRRSFFPTTRGIITSDSATAANELWFSQPSRGWSAFIDDNGNGMAQIADPAHIKRFYQWANRGPGALLTQEIHLEEVAIPAGESVRTSFQFIPFFGLKKVSGAGGGLVGSVDLNPESASGVHQKRTVKVKLFSALAQTVRIETHCRSLPEGGSVRADSREVVFKSPATTAEFAFEHTLPTFPTLYDIDVRIFSPDGSLLAVLNAPTAAGISMLGYRLDPLVPRAPGEAVAEVDLTAFDNSLETPHIDWAKPLAGGPIKVLAVTGYPAYRELAELAQRLDLELHSLIWTLPHKNLFATGRYYGTLTDEDVLNNLDRLLADDYDLILIGGGSWEHFRAAQREEIMRKVRSGTGLFEIGIAASEELMPGVSAQKYVGTGPAGSPVRARSGFLSDVLPFELMPKYLIRRGSASETAWAAVGEDAWLSSRKVGAGRSVNLAWYSAGGMGRMMPGLTPEIRYPDYGKTNPGFWEILHLIMAKSAVYAAGREPAFGFGPVTARTGNGEIKLDIDYSGQKPNEPLQLQLFIRDKENREKSTLRVPVAPDAAGRQRVKLPAAPFAGKQLLGLQLRNSAGEVVDFGAIAVEYAPKSSFAGISADRNAYREGDRAAFTVTIANPAAAEKLTWEWRDAYNRLLAVGEAAPDASVGIAVPVGDSLPMRSYVFIASLYADGKEVDRVSRAVTAVPEAEKLTRRNFEPGIWLTPRASDAIRPYLYPLLAGKLRELRMETVIANNTELDIDFATRFNFHPTRLEHAGTQAAKMPQAFVKSGNKRDLARTPCLSDPAFRNRMREKFRKLGEQYADLGLRFYWLGDELSLAGYWSNPIDFCFSDHCLNNFHQWLLRRYGSLEAVNRQWNSKFTSLDEVIPDTRQETRARTDGNHSAWADHLEYMDWLLCDFITDITENGLRRGDPKAETFISGPQEGSAYGGNDWQLQSQVYSGMMSYNYGALRECSLSFHPEGVDMPWVLGYAFRGPQVCYNIWQALMLGSKGIMAFHGPSLINPDYTFSDSARAIADYLPEAVDGIGQLIVFGLQRPEPEALVVYSQPSIRAAYIAGSSGDHTNLRWKHVTLCKNFGIPARITSPEDLARGILDRTPSVKLVLLPDIGAADDAMLAALERHLDKGGAVLVEGNLGVFDAHCRKMPDARLKKWPKLYAAVKASRSTPANSNYFPAWQKPVSMRNESDRAALADGVRRMSAACSKAGIKPAAVFRDAEGSPVWDLEMARFHDRAGNRYLMAITKSDEVRQLTFEPAAPCRMIYESHRKIGEDSRNRRQWDISAAHPFFAALLNQAEPEKPAVKVTSDGNRQFEFHVESATSRDTVYHFRLIAPDGGKPFWYRANIDAPGGKGIHRIRFALDDRPGTWRAEIRDVVTGAADSVELNLR